MSDDRFLHTFRRSGYAAPLRQLLRERLIEKRETMENEPVSDENVAQMKATKSIMREIFGDDNV